MKSRTAQLNRSYSAAPKTRFERVTPRLRRLLTSKSFNRIDEDGVNESVSLFFRRLTRF